MKNILKKIGVIGIIIAMLAPFVEMPVAKAATETCSDHTVMQYYFADVTNGDYWKQYTSTNGYTTYTIYPYLFPEESGKTIKILNTKVLDIETGSTPTSENGMTLANFWSDVELLQRSDFQKSGDDLSGTYVSKDKSDYRVVKILHGIWGRDTDGSYEPVNWRNIPEDRDKFLNHTVQDIFKNNSGLTISSARFLGLNKNNAFGAADETNLADYFKNLTSSDNKEYIEEVNGRKVFALRVSRKLDVDTLNTKHFGYECKTDDSCGAANVGKYAIFTDDSVDNPIKDSYSALVKAKNLEKIETNDTVARKIVNDAEEINVFVNEAYYWPAVLNVEYEVCTNTSEQWTLKYDGNTDDNSANNIPEKVQKSVTEDAEIDSKTPTRNGYTFKGWNTEKDGSGKTYNAGDEYKSPGKADVIVLYAQWGNASKGEQKPTGVASYIIGFISVGIVAGGIYLIAKKKNLFKQI